MAHPIYIRENRSKINEAREVIKHKKILKEIPTEEPRKHTLFNNRKFVSTTPDAIYCASKKRQISKERWQPPRDQPIKENIVRSVEPLLLPPHIWVVVFIEDIVKILHPPPKHWMFLETLVCHIPHHKARLGCLLRERYCRKTREHRTFFYKLRIAHRNKPTHKKSHRDKHPHCTHSHNFFLTFKYCN